MRWRVDTLDEVAQFLDECGLVPAYGRGDTAQGAAVLVPGRRGGVGDGDDRRVAVARLPAQDALVVEAERGEP
ncbi:hypothetical protein [Streptomyces sp. SAI-127]|uniref:hypothetical protein n=1 Tax=Streptomyces sp. SAI-127 TaxID=2940543 RepID=UPI00247396C5|nr:hypothetical protein [Streptomyces sp. SAI-127]MDH6485709.1 hypothetical protein [Streptomyces sp. SAI-127]